MGHATGGMKKCMVVKEGHHLQPFRTSFVQVLSPEIELLVEVQLACLLARIGVSIRVLVDSSFEI